MNKQLDFLLNLLPKCQHGSVFIAGGAAVEWEKASDVDVWFGNGKTAVAEKFFQALPFREVAASTAASYPSCALLGNGWHPEVGKIIQVMVTDKKNPTEQMETFDISTHMKAIDSIGKVWAGPFLTHPLQVPKVIKPNNKTFPRYIKICQRYGHPVDLDVLRGLMLHAESKTGFATVSLKTLAKQFKFGSNDDIPF